MLGMVAAARPYRPCARRDSPGGRRCRLLAFGHGSFPGAVRGHRGRRDRRHGRPGPARPDRAGARRRDRAHRPGGRRDATPGDPAHRGSRTLPAARLHRHPRPPRLLPAGGGAPRWHDQRAGPRLASRPPGSPAARRRAVPDQLAAAGASVIKVALDPTRGAPTLPAPTLAAVVAAAAERRLDVTAHVAGPAEVAKALDAGVTELAHWPFGEEPRGDLIRRMAASMTVVPTLHIDPSPARRRGVRAFVAAGGRVVYGTDLGNQGPPPAVDVAELELLVEAGLSPVGAVAAATSHAAEHLGLRAIGSVAPGWVADLLLVDGDPLEDLRALTRVRLVSRAGWIAG